MQTIPLTNKDAQKIKKTRTSLENQYMTKERKILYAAFEEKDFTWFWEPHELDALKALWNRDFNLLEMSEIFKRDPYEVFIMLLDRLEYGVFKPRAMGLGIVL